MSVSPLAPMGAPAAASTAAPRLSWSACQGGFQCATARVPLDYNHPTGATISLALIRLPAGNPHQRIGSLFVNPGGPGGSGVDIVRGIAQFLPLQLRGRFDIVGFDPRGVMRSTPLRCFPTFREALSVLPPFPFPLTPRQENVQGAADAALAAACAQRGGAILAHMSTADVARDMDLLRQAVGDRSLNYLGFSYGSFLARPTPTCSRVGSALW
ncbi:MAG: alpha/beta fold hydrolase [Frankiaceae bacterium]